MLIHNMLLGLFMLLGRGLLIMLLLNVLNLNLLLLHLMRLGLRVLLLGWRRGVLLMVLLRCIGTSLILMISHFVPHGGSSNCTCLQFYTILFMS